MTRMVITTTAPPRDRHGKGGLEGQVRAQRAARTPSARRVGRLGEPSKASGSAGSGGAASVGVTRILRFDLVSGSCGRWHQPMERASGYLALTGLTGISSTDPAGATLQLEP